MITTPTVNGLLGFISVPEGIFRMRMLKVYYAWMLYFQPLLLFQFKVLTEILIFILHNNMPVNAVTCQPHSSLLGRATSLTTSGRRTIG